MLHTFRTKVRDWLPEAWVQSYWRLTDSSYRSTYRENRLRATERLKLQRSAASLLSKQADEIVLQGPFKGLKLPLVDRGCLFTQKVLGTYELELWSVVRAVTAKPYASIINIGAGEGYYAIGMSRLMPSVPIVHAFEADRGQRQRLVRFARLNGTYERMEVHGFCDVTALKGILADSPKSLLIVDVEGYEDILLDPALIPELHSSELIVEMHDHCVENVTARLKQRFSASHEIVEIVARSRETGDLPPGIELAKNLALAAMDEARHPSMTWLWLSPKSVL